MMTRKVISVILGALMILAGVYCFFTPVETSAVIPFVLGIVMIGDSALWQFVNFNLVSFILKPHS